jgi:hypothetical protein
VAVGFACSVFLVACVYSVPGFSPPQLSRDFFSLVLPYGTGPADFGIPVDTLNFVISQGRANTFSF